jgi:hypothetical protein
VRTGTRIGLLVAIAVVGLAAPLPAEIADGAPACQSTVTQSDPSTPWAQQAVGSKDGWPVPGPTTVTVAVIGTGVSSTAPALAGRVLAGTDVRTHSTADSDCAGFGTFAAGLVGAAPLDGSGFVGVDPRTRILPVRVSDDGRAVEPDVLASAISWALDHGADVVAATVSASSRSGALDGAVARARQRRVPVVVPAAAERSAGGDSAEPHPQPGVVSVAAVDVTGHPAASSPGTPSLAAPGVGITSVPARGGGTFTASGAGLAVGFVAGAAALVISRYPDLPSEAVLARLTGTALPVAGTASAPLVGAGVVAPGAALAPTLPGEARPGDSTGRRRIELEPRPRPRIDRYGPAARRWALIVLAAAALGALLAGAARRPARPAGGNS